MANAPIIYPIDTPVSSLEIHLQGETDSSASGFVFSPTGGTFTSGSVSGTTLWSYDFILMAESQDFTIASFDASGVISPSSSFNITYELPPPIILEPGTPKTIRDNVSTSASTSENFVTMNGDFADEGIVVGDQVLSVDGPNINEISKIINVSEKIIKVEPFPYSFNEGNTIKIYSNEERPFYTSNKLDVIFSGKTKSSAKKVIYTTPLYQKPRYYSQINENYIIDSSNNTLHLVVDGKERIIELSQSSSLTKEDIVFEINNYFDYDVAFTSQNTFYLEAVTLEIKNANGNIYFGFEEGSWSLAYIVNFPDEFTLKEDDSNLVNLKIEDRDIRFTVEKENLKTKQEIINKINDSYPNGKVAFSGEDKLIFLANKIIHVKNTLDAVNLVENVVGEAVLSGEEWLFNFRIFKNSNTLNILVLDAFDRLTESSVLTVNYKIDPPLLSTTNLDVSLNVVDLRGSYDTEGQGVKINNLDAFSSGGSWSLKLENLVEGDNTVEAVTVDSFGGTSDPLNFTVTYTNPNNKPVEPGTSDPNLQWAYVATPSIAPEELIKVVEAIDSIFDPVISILETIKSILSIVRSFIVDNVASFVNLLKNAVQQFLDSILETIDNLINGSGIFILSTVPKYQDLANTSEFFERISQGFSGMISTMTRSFDDNLDPNRPQLGDDVVAGGYALAASDTGGVQEFLNAINQLTGIVQKEVLDYGLSSPQNINALGENERVVLTWESPDGIRPGAYEIYRSKYPNGEPQFVKVKNNATRDQQSSYREEPEIDPTTGQPVTKWDLIGTLSDNQIYKEFRFTDGIFTRQEEENQNFANQTATNLSNGVINSLADFRDSVLVQSGQTGKALKNGEQYFYKIIPTFIGSDQKGESFTVSATPQRPELEMITDSLTSQINNFDKNTGTTGLVYTLQGAVFDNTTGLFASDPSEQHLEIIVDGGLVKPSKVIYNKGIVYLKATNKPRVSIQATYWTKKLFRLTRARIEGSVSGPFTISKNDPSSNTLKIQVGASSSKASNLGTGGSSPTRLSMVQSVKLVRDFGNFEQKELSSDEVISLIRSQTAGLRVTRNRNNQIVLIDDQNPNQSVGSTLKIVEGNKSLGFETGQTSEAGPQGGTSPDWFRLSPADLFPEINDILRYVENTLNQFFKGLDSATNALSDFIDLLIQKVEALQDIIERIKELVKKATDILTVQAGLYYLKIPPQTGGNNYLKSALQNATGAPNGDFAAGVLLVYGDGATQKALDFLFAPFG